MKTHGFVFAATLRVVLAVAALSIAGRRRPPCRRRSTISGHAFALPRIISALYAEQVTASCGNNNFCPNSNVTNGRMPVFLVEGFKIP